MKVAILLPLYYSTNIREVNFEPQNIYLLRNSNNSCYYADFDLAASLFNAKLPVWSSPRPQESRRQPRRMGKGDSPLSGSWRLADIAGGVLPHRQHGWPQFKDCIGWLKKARARMSEFLLLKTVCRFGGKFKIEIRNMRWPIQVVVHLKGGPHLFLSSFF